MDSQKCGFQKGRWHKDQLLSLRTLTEKYLVERENIFIQFIGLKKIYVSGEVMYSIEGATAV